MVLIKIAMVGVAIVALMTFARDQRWFERAGVVGTCYATSAPSTEPDGVWYACKQGIVNGFPNLEADACTSQGVVRHLEVWQCSKALASLPRA